jgi:uncharacterized protein (DUF305 family)
MRRLLLPVFTAGALVVTACGGDDTEPAATEQPATSAAASASASTDVNKADVTFVQGMIPHHEQAVEMAELALDPRAQVSPPVKDLATRVQQAQDPEIQQMRTWLRTWGEEEMDTSGDMTGHAMEGMMSASDMDSLEQASGPTFDQRWMEMMIEHHEGAISVAQKVKTDGSNPDVKALADQIITAQQTEIDEMRGLMA